MTLDYTLLDYYDTSLEKLALANHEPGPKCRCDECGHLKSIEDKWLVNLGTLYDDDKGMNSRDELKSKSRCQW